MNRVLVALPLLLACAAAPAGAEPVPAPNSGSILLHLHPRAWRPPAPLVSGGLRAEADPQEDGTGTSLAGRIAAARAANMAALAHLPVQFRPDGSRFVVLDGLLRAYAVARVGAGGRLEEDCADSEAKALEWLGAPQAPANAARPTPAAEATPTPVMARGLTRRSPPRAAARGAWPAPRRSSDQARAARPDAPARSPRCSPRRRASC